MTKKPTPHAAKRGGTQSQRERRRRKYEADPAELLPEDQPSKRLTVDPVAVAELCKVMGFTR